MTALLAFESWLLYVWRWIDTRPSRADDSVHLQMSEAWRQAVLAPSTETLTYAAQLAAWKTPPLWLALIGLIQAVGGTAVDFTVWVSSTLAYGLLMLFTYLTGRLLYGRLAGFGAAAIITLNTGAAIVSHLYLLDVPLMAVVAAAIYGLARLLRPQATRADVALASLLLGVACLTRWQSPFYLWLPVLFVLGWRWRLQRARGASITQATSHLARLALAFGAGVAVLLGPFLAANLATFIDTVNRIVVTPRFESYGGAAQYDGPALTWFSIGWYARSWPEFEYVGQPLYLALAALGLVVSLVAFRTATWFLLAWAAGSYFTWWLLPNKEPRYDLPFLTAFALVSCAPLALLPRLHWPRARTAALASLVLALAIGYGLASRLWLEFGLQNPLLLLRPAELVASGQFAHSMDPVPTEYLFSIYRRFARPATENWQVDEIVEDLKQARRHLDIDRARVALIPFLEYFHAGPFYYAIQVDNDPISIQAGPWTLRDPETRELLLTADLVVTKTGQVVPSWERFQEWEAFARAASDPSTEFGSKVAQRFVVFARRPLPDGSEALLMANRQRLNRISLDRALDRARIQAPDPSFVSPARVVIRGERRGGLMEHPPAGGGETSVTFTIPRLPPSTVFDFAIALKPEAWGAPGDGVEFRVEVDDGSGRAVLFRHSLDPKNNPDDRRWYATQLDLNGYSGRRIELALVTTSGPAGDNRMDWAVWGDPVLLTPNLDPPSALVAAE